MTDPVDLDSLLASDLTQPVTGQQIRNVILPETRLGRRGYDKTAVHQLLSRLATDIDSLTKSVTGLQVTANAMAVEVTHRRGGYLPDYSLADLRISAQMEAMRHGDDVIAVAQNHARDLVNAARQQAAALVTADKDSDEDVVSLRRRLHHYQQLAHTMNDYLNYIVGVLASAHTSFEQRFTAIDTNGQLQGEPSEDQQTRHA